MKVATKISHPQKQHQSASVTFMKSDVILWEVLQYLDMLCIICMVLISLGMQSIMVTYKENHSFQGEVIFFVNTETFPIKVKWHYSTDKLLSSG